MTSHDSADMVDWDLAVATARRLAKPGPAVSAEEARSVVTDLKAFAEEADRTGSLVHRAGRDGRGGTGRRRRPGWLGAGQRRRDAGDHHAAHRQASRPQDQLRAAGPGRAQGDRRRNRSVARVPVREGARPVRPVLVRRIRRPTRQPMRGPAAARRPERRPRRAGARASIHATSGCGCACTRRPTGSSSPRCRGCATTSAPRSRPSSPRLRSTRPSCSPGYE